MRTFTTILVSLSFTLAAFGQNVSGFTNKWSAKNEMKDGLKNGKWVEYTDSNANITKDTNAPYYRLTIYKNGEPDGIVRGYDRSRNLMYELTYTDGKENGVAKIYYGSGLLEKEIPFVNGKISGVEKEYYPNGKLKSETPYVKGKEGATKLYNETEDESK